MKRFALKGRQNGRTILIEAGDYKPHENYLTRILNISRQPTPHQTC